MRLIGCMKLLPGDKEMIHWDFNSLDHNLIIIILRNSSFTIRRSIQGNENKVHIRLTQIQNNLSFTFG